MTDAARTAPTAQGTSGALRVRKIASSIYGALAILLGLLLLAFGALAFAARSTGSTYGDMIETPAAVPAIFGPYVLVLSIVFIVLGFLVFKQSVIAAISLLVFNLATDALGYFVPALNVDGVASFSSSDITLDAIVVILTAIVVIADRAARRVQS
jgi:uncharacterized membrane protein YidH (DUF202 family)